MIRFKVTCRFALWITISLALSAAARTALPAASDILTSWEIDAESGYVGEAGSRGGNDETGSFDEWRTDLKLLISPQVTKDLLLRFGAQWQRLGFGVSDRAVVPAGLHQVRALLGLDYQLNDQWLLRADVQPGLYTDFKDVSWRDVDAPLLLSALDLANADLQWFFGARLDFRSQFPVLPALGVRWRFADQWTLNLLLPNPRLEYDLSDKLKAYLGGGAELATFTVGDQFGNGRGQPDLNHAHLDYFEIRIGPGVSWKIGPRFTIEAEVGCMIYRVFDYFDQDVTVRSDPAPYAQLACRIRF